MVKNVMTDTMFWSVTTLMLCVLECHCSDVVCSGTSLLYCGVLWHVTVLTWCVLEHLCSEVVCS
jgi:hypothetical protein